MNLILFEEDDVASRQGETMLVEVRDRRLLHLQRTLRAEVGDPVVLGLLGGRIGTGRLVALESTVAGIEVLLDREPPAPAPLSVVLALPRPPMLRRLLQAIVTLGVKELFLINSSRVEKSFWQSSVLEPQSIERHLRLGLEQAVDTVLPRVHLEKRFRPFVEDRLPERLDHGPILVADPRYETGAAVRSPASAGGGPSTLVVGPEGGFIPFELSLLEEVGAVGVGLGERIQRVETAVVSLIARATVAG